MTLSPGPILALTLSSPVPVGIVLCLLKLRFLPYKADTPLNSVGKIHPKAFKGTKCFHLLGPLLHFELRPHVLSVHRCSWTCFLLSDFQKGFVLGVGRDSFY